MSSVVGETETFLCLNGWTQRKMDKHNGVSKTHIKKYTDKLCKYKINRQKIIQLNVPVQDKETKITYNQMYLYKTHSDLLCIQKR